MRHPGPEKRASVTDDWRCCGFTLLETVIALGIVVMLAAVATVTIGRGHERRQFDEGVRRFEGALRMARIEAAREGKRFRLSFDQSGDGAASLHVEWEAQPLTAPGEFSDFANLSTWAGYMPGDELRIVSCRLIGSSEYRLPGDTEEQGEGDTALQSITFYPDGSGDSALVILAPRDSDDAIRAAVRLDGLNAVVKTLTVTDDELEENLQDIERGLYAPPEDAEY